MDQKKWHEVGSEGPNAFREMLDFERTFKPELDEKIRAHAVIEEKIQTLGTKLNQAQVAYEKSKSIFFAGLREAEVRLRSDLRKEITTREAKGEKISDVDFEEMILEALEPKAKGVTALRKQALSILELERDLAKLRLDAAMLEEWPFQKRREAARHFCETLFQVGGLAVQFQTVNSSLDHARRWSAELSRLTEQIAVASGSLKRFNTLGLSAGSPDGVLEFASYAPENKLPQILEAWQACKLAKGTGCGISFSQNGKITWRYLKSKEPDRRVGVSSSDFGGGFSRGR